MRVTSKGQVTIPQAVREKLGILPNTEVEFTVRGDSATLRKVPPRKGGRDRGREIVERLRGSGHGRLTTDEMLKLMRGDD
jgi:AbrB family looped-hinge helix DNA binding protein